MKPEEQRIAIAEACGWTLHQRDGVEYCWSEELNKNLPSNDDGMRKCPDYLNDLNAMHEAEKTLSHEETYRYGDALAAVVRKPEIEAMKRIGMDEDDEFPFNGWGYFEVSHLTAAQRAEAFLRTIGKWKE